VKAIELALTPHQIVLLWLNNAVKRTFEGGARQSPPPRAVLANSVSSSIRNSLKGQLDPLVQRAIVQARQEADWLYNIVILVNAAVQNDFLQSNREYLFLAGYLSAVARTSGDFEEELAETDTGVC
jgi:hypothetical protein